MNDLKEVPFDTDIKDKKESFSFSKEVDGVTKTLSGRQVENGWLVTIRKEWRDEPKEGSDYREWHSKEFEYVTKTNPVEDLKKKKKEEKGEGDTEITKLLSAFATNSGMLLVD